MSSDNVKIIFLDIDGVLLSGKALLMPQNMMAKKKLRESDDAKSRHTKVKEFAMSSQFDPCAIALVNRLAEVSGAKIVVQSNWRRNIGFDETKEKLIEQGILPTHFHEDWVCMIRGFSSEKIHDMYEWMSQHNISINDKKDDYVLYETQYVVLDDQVNYMHYKDGYWVDTDFNEGFSVNDYRIACGLLGADDPAMDVYRLEAQTLDAIRPHFENDVTMGYWLHSGFFEGKTACPATLLSRKAYDFANKRSFFLISSHDDDQLYETRSRDVFDYIENRKKFR